ncbi:MAG: hypothetical protein EXR99_02640 [Gemmataceae bacterium]|nr:hypothetical protein [Gemmataceae bacterium]
MNQENTRIPSSTRDLDANLSRLLKELKNGDRIRVSQQIRIGSTATWNAVVEGSFRHFDFLATGLATDRVPEDDIVVVCVHFTKDNGELTSFTVDEFCKLEKVG